ncbi:Piso0_002092 [Millerozyma farinosa CBS 7064]|uniref:Piso0_002092 protein n=1 Tax=Pichia sorbitophila (strain ATCC MYA-4447 / BCRC 22081 / CBS 7064 / NBRC 10061 / NRRL Y-12695) TaxID=559304 RepID=G8YE37_PICSO|nr:Piso0_002092 [Millerozyma farinosa CBS 7064]
MSKPKPLVLHMNPVRFAQESWAKMNDIAEVIFIKEYSREQFIEDLHGKFNNVTAIGRGYLTKELVGLFDEELISQFPSSLKYIAHQGAGYDQVSVSALTAKNILLSHCPDIINNSTADTNLYLLLGAMRNFEAGRCHLYDGKWPAGGFGAGAKEGWSPKKKILGIIGMGGIGQAFRDRAVPLGFEKIVYYNRKRLSKGKEKECQYMSSLDELVKVADVISINCPLNKSTYHLINSSLIEKMKFGVIIVNTARGSVIDQDALVENLKTGKVGAAGLDVFENEPYVPKTLLDLPNVLALPHMGTHSIQTVYEMEQSVIDNIYKGIVSNTMITIVPEQRNSFS